MRSGYRLSPSCAHDESDFCQSCYIGADGFTDSERIEYNSPKNVALRAVDDFFVMLSDKAHEKDVAKNGPNEELSRRSLHDVPLTMNEILKIKIAYYNKIGIVK